MTLFVSALALCGCTSTARHATATSPTAVTIATPTRPTHTASLDQHRAMIAVASWSHPGPGYRLHVHPTVFGRTVADEHPGRALAQAVRLARPTPLHLSVAITDSLRNQLRCHAAFAPHKPVWHLETWRPDVSYTSTVLHACNP